MAASGGGSTLSWVVQGITAAVAVLALVLSGMQYWHRPAKATIRLVAFSQVREEGDWSRPKASVAVVNTGKRDIVVAGAFVQVDPGQLCPSIPSVHPGEQLPSSVPAGETKLLTASFWKIDSRFIMANTPPGHSREVDARVFITIVDRKGALRDIRAGSVRLRFGEDGSLGWSASPDANVATLDDVEPGPGRLTMMTQSAIGGAIQEVR